MAGIESLQRSGERLQERFVAFSETAPVCGVCGHRVRIRTEIELCRHQYAQLLNQDNTAWAITAQYDEHSFENTLLCGIAIRVAETTNRNAVK